MVVVMVDALLALVVGGACTALVTRARYGKGDEAVSTLREEAATNERRWREVVAMNKRLRELNLEAETACAILAERCADHAESARALEARLERAHELLSDELRKKVA